MARTRADVPRSLYEALTELGSVVGQQVQLVSVGWGSGLTLELGPTLLNGRAAWHLWIQQAMWRLELPERTLVGSEDGDLDVRVQSLTGQVLHELHVNPRTMDALFVLSDVRLRTFSTVTEDETDLWLLFAPDSRVFTAESGPNWGFEPSKTERSLTWRRPTRPLSELPRQLLDQWPADAVLSTRVRDMIVGQHLVDVKVDASAPFGIGLDTGRLMIADAAWRIEHRGAVIVGYGDGNISRARDLVGLGVRFAEVSSVSRDLTLELDHEFVLRTFTQRSSPASQQWSLEFDDGRKLVAEQVDG